MHGYTLDVYIIMFLFLSIHKHYNRMGDNPELEELLSELNGVETKCRPIGKYLGLRDEVLQAITQDHSDPQNQLPAVLIKRRKRGSLPWSAIIETLEDKTVGEDGLALRLRMKYKTEVDEQPRKVSEDKYTDTHTVAACSCIYNWETQSFDKPYSLE